MRVGLFLILCIHCFYFEDKWNKRCIGSNQLNLILEYSCLVYSVEDLVIVQINWNEIKEQLYHLMLLRKKSIYMYFKAHSALYEVNRLFYHRAIEIKFLIVIFNPFSIVCYEKLRWRYNNNLNFDALPSTYAQ